MLSRPTNGWNTPGYANEIRMMERLPDALAHAMGNQLFLAVFDTQEALDAFYKDAVECI